MSHLLFRRRLAITMTMQYLDKYGELLPKTKRFCEMYFSGGGSVKQCMIESGFSMHQATIYGSEVLTYPEVKAYLTMLDSQVRTEVVASKEDVLCFWTQVMGDASEKTSDRIGASKLLAQYLKMMDTGDKGEDKPIIVFDIQANEVDIPDSTHKLIPQPKQDSETSSDESPSNEPPIFTEVVG